MACGLSVSLARAALCRRTRWRSICVPLFERLRESEAPIVHYKTCSTFDSSPEIGSIGKALEIGREVFGNRCVPILAGAPSLGRYTVFGNLFARSGLDTEPFRLDRHPTMVKHPITPMTEADLRVHLSKQTSLPVGMFDVLCLEDAHPHERLAELLAEVPAAILFDIISPRHLTTIGALVQELSRPGEPLFAIGSSGIEYALAAHWEQAGTLSERQSHAAGEPTFGPVEQLVVITGSCSPVNDRQISWALQHGFVELPLPTSQLIAPHTRETAIADVVARGRKLLKEGKNLILHSSLGPDDPRIEQTQRQYAALGFCPEDVRRLSARTLGPQLGRILWMLLAGRPLARAGVAGGDTSYHVACALGVEALEAVAPVAPGSPLCRVHASNELNGLEIIFKGGQVGQPDLWGTFLNGTA